MRWILLAPVAFSSVADAAVNVVGKQTSDAPLSFSEAGTFLAAANFNGPTDTRGTNVFQGAMLSSSTSPAKWTTSGLSFSISASAGGTLASATLPTPTDDLYLSEIYSPNQLTMSLTISGLNSSLTYVLQFPHGEDRTLLYTGTQTFLDSSNSSTTTPLSFGDTTTTPIGQKFSLTTVVISNSTSLTYDMPPSDSPGNRGPSFDGFTVRIVPEPAVAAVLLGLSLLLQRKRGSFGHRNPLSRA